MAQSSGDTVYIDDDGTTKIVNADSKNTTFHTEKEHVPTCEPIVVEQHQSIERE